MRNVWALALMCTLAACDGPMGPEGPQGPPGQAGPQGTTRLMVTGLIAEDGAVEIQLPAAVGTNPLEPPAMSCYLRDPQSPGVWWAVNDGWSSDSAFCVLMHGLDNTNTWWAVMFYAPPSLTAAFVIIY